MKIDRQKLIKIALPAGIILLGFVLMMALIKLRPAPKKAAPDNKGVLVRVETLSATDWEVTVTGTATARARQEISVIPQVTGTVKSLVSGFAEGGFFKKGQALFSIDPTDYKLALRQALAAEARAEYELEQIKSRADIARKEWELVSSTPGAMPPDTLDNERLSKSEPNPLVLYEPQMKNVRASLESASAMVELARLNLERTTIRAPFDCRVRTKNVDVGQFVRSGTPVAVLAGTGAAEVVMPLERNELSWIDIPGPGSGGPGSRALVTVSGSAPGQGWEGRVVRSGGEVDQRSRMVQVVVEVDDPYGLKQANAQRPPLMNGSFVNVTIKGKTLKDVFVIPRAALRDNSTVWAMDRDGYLRIKKVDVARFEGDRAIITGGLEENASMVLTKVSGAADGMKLRTSSMGAGIGNSTEPDVASQAGDSRAGGFPTVDSRAGDSRAGLSNMPGTAPPDETGGDETETSR